MTRLTMNAVFRPVVLAGLAAALILAAFHAVFTEPVIDQAIALEESISLSQGHAAEEPLVSRGAQRWGLVAGFLLYGMAWSLIFGVTFSLAQELLGNRSVLRRAAVLGAALWWSVGMLPMLKYPPNPPGVGDPETIGYRQTLYVVFLLLSVAGTVLALFVARRRGLRPAYSAGLVAVMGGVLWLAMPGNPDAMTMPEQLVLLFRVLSMAGITLFWFVLALAFGLLATPTPEPGTTYARPVGVGQ